MKELTSHIKTHLLAAILLMTAAVSCVEPFTPVDPIDDKPSFSLTLQISAPGPGSPATKAEPETINPEATEAAVKELQIWAFKNGDNSGSAVAYTYIPSTAAPTADGIYEAMLIIPRTVVASGTQKLDFYVVANGSSIGGVSKKSGDEDVTGTMTRQEVMALAFGKSGSEQTATDYFGASTNAGTVASLGLPMSCFDNTGFDITFLQYSLTTLQVAALRARAMGSNKNDPYDLSAYDSDAERKFTDAQKEYIQNTLCPREAGMTSYPSWSTLWSKICPAFVLKRSVSKIRLVFTKASNMTDSTKIISVEVFSNANDQGAIPTSTYIFEHNPVAFPSNTYEQLSWGTTESPLLANDDIHTIDTPYRLLWTSGTSAQDYTTLLNTARTKGEVTEKLLYLRESDRSLQCKVTYKIGGTVAEKTFSLPAGASFLRNNWWTIYAFFMSYKLNFQIIVNDWDAYDKGTVSIGTSV